jgi:hypothetical protein
MGQPVAAEQETNELVDRREFVHRAFGGRSCPSGTEDGGVAVAPDTRN